MGMTSSQAYARHGLDLIFIGGEEKHGLHTIDKHGECDILLTVLSE
jgi:hypothetical protein